LQSQASPRKNTKAYQSKKDWGHGSRDRVSESNPQKTKQDKTKQKKKTTKFQN
jgi:hypothetical protein